MCLRPRLCCLRLTEGFAGYGFSLVATKNQVGQFIEDVKTDSPAYLAGLKNEDMVFEVNGINILNLSHQQVVELIKKDSREVNFLVLSPEAREHYKNSSVVVNSQMKEVQRICSWSKAKDNENETVSQTNRPNPILPPDHGETSTGEGDKSDVLGNSADSRKPNFPKLSAADLKARALANSRRNRTTVSGTSFGDRAKLFDEL